VGTLDGIGIVQNKHAFISDGSDYEHN